MGEEISDSDQEIPEEPGKMPPGTEPVFIRDQKLRRFLLGFVGWWVVNIPLYLLIGESTTYELTFVNCIVQVVVLIIMVQVNRWVGLGLVAAVALNLVISLSLGLFFNVLCWIPFTTPLQ